MRGSFGSLGTTVGFQLWLTIQEFSSARARKRSDRSCSAPATLAVRLGRELGSLFGEDHSLLLVTVTLEKLEQIVPPD